MTKRYYQHCGDCGTRMRRTGRKDKVGETLEGYDLFEREYECPRCHRNWLYNERTNMLRRGFITPVEVKTARSNREIEKREGLTAPK